MAGFPIRTPAGSNQEALVEAARVMQTRDCRGLVVKRRRHAAGVLFVT